MQYSCNKCDYNTNIIAHLEDHKRNYHSKDEIKCSKQDASIQSVWGTLPSDGSRRAARREAAECPITLGIVV